MDHFDVDAIVIGAGIIGLATAAALAQKGKSVLVLEKGGYIGAETSSRNSEVIHAGIYYQTNSLKHQACLLGRRRLYSYLESRGINHRRCGKLIVATTPDEVVKVEGIYHQGVANSVEGLSLVSSKAVKDMEPEVRCQMAILSDQTGILDSHAFLQALEGDLSTAGGQVVLGTEVVGIDCLSDSHFMVTTGGSGQCSIACSIVVNAAGLWAPSLAAKAIGYDTKLIPPRYFAKGNYFSCTRSNVFQKLIYPAPVDGGLGIHATIDLGGRLRFGPDVEWLDTQDPLALNYNVAPERLEPFYEAIRQYWPNLPDNSLQPDFCGIRPKLSSRGEPARDFELQGPAQHGIAGLVHFFGIESPGLTSSLHLSELAMEHLDL